MPHLNIVLKDEPIASFLDNCIKTQLRLTSVVRKALEMYMNSEEGKALQRFFKASNHKKINED